MCSGREERGGGRGGCVWEGGKGKREGRVCVGGKGRVLMVTDTLEYY